jgi:hypothetical protein
MPVYSPDKIREPKVEQQTFHDWCEGNFPLIYPQDSENMPKVQRGMKSRGLKASRPSRARSWQYRISPSFSAGFFKIRMPTIAWRQRNW